jgi:hypothetical protein
VLNTSASVELLPLWLVSGYHAYSLQVACPLGKSQEHPNVHLSDFITLCPFCFPPSPPDLIFLCPTPPLSFLSLTLTLAEHF